MTDKTWDRSLGTSKQEQGIITPPPPRKHPCGCWLRGKDMDQMCETHKAALEWAMRIAKEAEENKKNVPVLPPTPTPATPWVEHVGATDAVSVGISTPGEDNGQS